MVRVYDDYVDIKDQQTGHLKGNLRVILYLEDNGIQKVQMNSLQQARDFKMNNSAPKQTEMPPSSGAGPPNGDYQAVWQLEMWKRAEEAKFKAYLKQREIEKIEEITYSWKMKESDRESNYNESLRQMETLEGKLRQKALDL